MIRGINVELTIRDNETGSYLQIPVVPPEIPYHDGMKKAVTVSILNLGDIDYPDGVELDSMNWASFFPARYDAAYCATTNLRKPVDYRNQFSSWKDHGTSLQVICPTAGINKEMYLVGFDWKLAGPEGDFYYTVDLKELKHVKPKQLTPGGQAPPPGQKGPAERPPAPAAPTPKTYTVVAGDNLIKIAKKLGISDWRKQIYEPNRATIGPDPNKINPGQRLVIK